MTKHNSIIDDIENIDDIELAEAIKSSHPHVASCWGCQQRVAISLAKRKNRDRSPGTSKNT